MYIFIYVCVCITVMVRSVHQAENFQNVILCSLSNFLYLCSQLLLKHLHWVAPLTYVVYQNNNVQPLTLVWIMRSFTFRNSYLSLNSYSQMAISSSRRFICPQFLGQTLSNDNRFCRYIRLSHFRSKAKLCIFSF